MVNEHALNISSSLMFCNLCGQNACHFIFVSLLYVTPMSFVFELTVMCFVKLYVVSDN